MTLHRLILVRLLAAWVVISLLIGVAVSWIGVRKIDHQLVKITTADLKKFDATDIELFRHPESAAAALNELARRVVRGPFISGELQDRHRRRVAEAVNPQHAEMMMEVARLAIELPLDPQSYFRKFTASGQEGLRVLVPIKEADGGTAGYFEGAFVIDQETLHRLRDDLALTLAVVLVAVTLTTACFYPIILGLHRKVMCRTRDLLNGNIELMEVVGSAVAKRDSATSMHNYRVATYAVRLAEAVGLDAANLRHLIAGAFLHDVGKIGISDVVLLKPGPLTPDEIALMQRHVALGVDILRKSNWLLQARDVVECHHERFDGSGYPRGLAGEDIPLTARVFAVVDVFDALTSKRPYKEALSLEEALKVIRDGAGRLFDPRLAEAFAGIAESVYQETAQLPGPEMEARLQHMIGKYFYAMA